MRRRKVLSKEDQSKRKIERAAKRRVRELRKNAILEGGWDEIIAVVSAESNPDISLYRERLEKASITLEMLRDMALNRSMRLRIMGSGTVEISFRKGDHVAVTTITEDGRVNTMMKDFLDY